MAKRKTSGGGSHGNRTGDSAHGAATGEHPAVAAVDSSAAAGISRSTADADAPPAPAGAPKPIRWTFFRRYRILFLVYGVGILAGAHEYLYKKDRPTFEWLSADGQVLLEMLSQLDPHDPDTKHLRAMNALAEGDQGRFQQLLDSALATGAKHNEKLLRFHAEFLLASGGDLDEVNAALNRWRENFPFSIDLFPVRLPSGPETGAQAEALEAALAGIPWIAQATLERHTETATAQWIVQIRFRRGHPVEVRDLMSALQTALRG